MGINGPRVYDDWSQCARDVIDPSTNKPYPWSKFRSFLTFQEASNVAYGSSMPNINVQTLHLTPPRSRHLPTSTKPSHFPNPHLHPGNANTHYNTTSSMSFNHTSQALPPSEIDVSELMSKAKMTQTETFDTFAKRLRSMYRRVAAAADQYDESFIVCCFLSGLDENFEPIRIANTNGSLR